MSLRIGWTGDDAQQQVRGDTSGHWGLHATVVMPPGTVPHSQRRGFLAALACGLAACAGGTSTPGAGQGGPAPVPPEPKELVVLAAASLTDAFTELGEGFSRQPEHGGVKLTYGFGASSQLRAQLEQGAPADVFASADTAQMDLAARAGLLLSAPQVFAHNRLVVALPRDNRAGITSVADLARPGIKLVTTPRDVPVGNYTRQALEKMAADPQFGAGFDLRVLQNVVSEEANVRQVVTKVQLGEADAGVVYASDVAAKALPEVRLLEIPEPFNVLAAYPMAVTRQARAPRMAQRFVEYALSAAGQALLKKHGFIPVA